MNRFEDFLSSPVEQPKQEEWDGEGQ
jgi:hypothetical protein